MNGLVKMLGTKADNLSLILETHMKEATDPAGCPLDLCKHHGITQTNELKAF